MYLIEKVLLDLLGYDVIIFFSIPRTDRSSHVQYVTLFLGIEAKLFGYLKRARVFE